MKTGRKRPPVVRTIGQKPSWLTRDEMRALHDRASAARGEIIEIEADDLARLVESNRLAEDGYSEVRAACRREIMILKAAHLEEVTALRRKLDGAA